MSSDSTPSSTSTSCLTVNGLTTAVLIVYTEARQPWLRVTKVYPCGQSVRNSPNALLNKGTESLLLLALCIKIRLSDQILLRVFKQCGFSEVV